MIRRRLLTLCSALSLLLCLAVCALWVSSHRAGHYYAFDAPAGRAVVWASRGQVLFHYAGGARTPGPTGYRRATNNLPVRMMWVAGIKEGVSANPGTFAYRSWGGAGFHWAAFEVRSRPRRYLTVPLWAMCFGLLLLPAARTTGYVICRWRASRRLWAGRCPACGYDLRASPGRCPECGAVDERAAAPEGSPCR